LAKHQDIAFAHSFAKGRGAGSFSQELWDG
jgi:hypothetical protein